MRRINLRHPVRRNNVGNRRVRADPSESAVKYDIAQNRQYGGAIEAVRRDRPARLDSLAQSAPPLICAFRRRSTPPSPRPPVSPPRHRVPLPSNHRSFARPPLTPPDGAPRAPRMTKPGTGGDERVSPPSRSPPTVNRYRHISSRPLASKRTVLVYLDEARPRTVAKALWGMGCGAGTAAMFAVKREGWGREGAGTGESIRRLSPHVGEVVDQIVPNMGVRKQPMVPELKGGGPCADAVFVQQRREHVTVRR